ncbi:MAG: hypothetical protein WDM80_08145 [Limisphaerales bacterium]
MRPTSPRCANSRCGSWPTMWAWARRNFTASRPARVRGKTSHRLMVAVSASPLSESLIRWARRMADSLQCPWLAVHVENSCALDEAAQLRLEKNLAPRPYPRRGGD